MILFLVRHGEPDYASDTLTALGRRQANALVPRFEKLKFSHIFCSSNGRARQTAEPTAQKLNMNLEIEPWTSEDLVYRDFFRKNEDPDEGGHWVFNVPAYKFHTPENRRRDTDWMECDCLKNGGSDGDFGFHPADGMARLKCESDLFLAKLGYERDGGLYRITRANNENVALFAHHGFTLCWLSYLLDIPPQLMFCSILISFTGVTMISFENYRTGKTAPRILCLNDLSHLTAANIPVEYGKHQLLS